jgi:hypothetical protein
MPGTEIMSSAKRMSLGPWTRQIHRWVSIAFTVTVIANFVVRARGTPPSWLTYSPLLPLAVLLLTGLYLFAMPYVARRLIRSVA